MNLSRLRELISKNFGEGFKDLRMEELAGDASTRRYYRVKLEADVAGKEVPESVVVMSYPPAHVIGGELSFINVHRYLDRAGVSVPRIFFHAPEENLLFLEDAGDTTLETVVGTKDFCEKTILLYTRAVEEMIRIQDSGTALLDDEAQPKKLSFDSEKLMWEMDFFYTWGPGKLENGASMERLREGFVSLLGPVIEEITEMGHVLAHRDYHSRNIMVKEDGTLKILDFQDARMGCIYYDMASLLLDSYVYVPLGVRKELVRYYMDKVAGKAFATFSGTDEFLDKLHLMAIQRNIKALGTFFYMHFGMGREKYLNHVGLTVRHIEENPVLSERFGELKDFIMPLLHELKGKLDL